MLLKCKKQTKLIVILQSTKHITTHNINKGQVYFNDYEKLRQTREMTRVIRVIIITSG